MKRILQITSLIICIVFTCTTVVHSSPDFVYRYSVPEEHGRVKERWKPKDADPQKSPVIHIQDAHTSFEAQKNIGNIIKDIVKQNTSQSLVCAEGAAGPCLTGEYASFPQAWTKKFIAEQFLRRGKFSGAEYEAIVSPQPFELYGVEEPELYIHNYEAYYKVVALRTDALAAIKQIMHLLKNNENDILQTKVKKLFTLHDDFENQRVDIFDYVKTLHMHASQHDVSLLDFPNVALFYEAVSLQCSIDYDVLERTKQSLIEILNKKADKGYVLNFPSDDNSLSKEYYEKLLHDIQEIEVNTIDYEIINLYVAYLKKMVRIDVAALMSELRLLKWILADYMVITEEERCFVQLMRVLEVLEICVNLRALPKDISYLSSNRTAFDGKVIKANLKKITQIEENISYAIINEIVHEIEKFYQYAHERNNALVEHTIQKMDNTHSQVQPAVLIAGGYHTDGITSELRKRNVPYVVVTPKITNAKHDLPYEERMLFRPSVIDDVLQDVSFNTLAYQLLTAKNPLMEWPLIQSQFTEENNLVKTSESIRETHKHAVLLSLYILGFIYYVVHEENENAFVGENLAAVKTIFTEKISQHGVRALWRKYNEYLASHKWIPFERIKRTVNLVDVADETILLNIQNVPLSFDLSKLDEFDEHIRHEKNVDLQHAVNQLAAEDLTELYIGLFDHMTEALPVKTSQLQDTAPEITIANCRSTFEYGVADGELKFDIYNAKRAIHRALYSISEQSSEEREIRKVQILCDALRTKNAKYKDVLEDDILTKVQEAAMEKVNTRALDGIFAVYQELSDLLRTMEDGSEEKETLWNLYDVVLAEIENLEKGFVVDDEVLKKEINHFKATITTQYELVSKAVSEGNDALAAIQGIIGEIRDIFLGAQDSVGLIDAEKTMPAFLLFKYLLDDIRLERYSTTDRELPIFAARIHKLFQINKNFEPGDIHNPVERILDEVEVVFAEIIEELSYERKKVKELGKERKRVVLVVADYSPQKLSSIMEEYEVVAIITDRKHSSAHFIISATEKNIPVFYDVRYENEPLYNSTIIKEGNTVFVAHAESPTIVINPHGTTEEILRDNAISKMRKSERLFNVVRDTKSITQDGEYIKLQFNVDHPESIGEAEDAVGKEGGEGIGLFRSEYLYTEGKEPTESELIEIFSQLVRKTNGLVTVRLLDYQPAKLEAWHGVWGEHYGIDLYRHQGEKIVRQQIRALMKTFLKAPKKNIRILVPSAASHEDIMFVKQNLIEDERGRLAATLTQEERELLYKMPVGFMIENEAITQGRALKTAIGESDFLSIGTNDLVNDLLENYYPIKEQGEEREERRASEYFTNEFLVTLDRIIENVKNLGNKEISVCGELGHDERMILYLLTVARKHGVAIGVSFNPVHVIIIKPFVAMITNDDLDLAEAYFDELRKNNDSRRAEFIDEMLQALIENIKKREEEFIQKYEAVKKIRGGRIPFLYAILKRFVRNEQMVNLWQVLIEQTAWLAVQVACLSFGVSQETFLLLAGAAFSFTISHFFVPTGFRAPPLKDIVFILIPNIATGLIAALSPYLAFEQMLLFALASFLIHYEYNEIKEDTDIEKTKGRPGRRTEPSVGWFQNVRRSFMRTSIIALLAGIITLVACTAEGAISASSPVFKEAQLFKSRGIVTNFVARGDLIQFGAFRNRDGAERIVRTLQAASRNEEVTYRVVHEGNFYRVIGERSEHVKTIKPTQIKSKNDRVKKQKDKIIENVSYQSSFPPFDLATPETAARFAEQVRKDFPQCNVRVVKNTVYITLPSLDEQRIQKMTDIISVAAKVDLSVESLIHTMQKEFGRNDIERQDDRVITHGDLLKSSYAGATGRTQVKWIAAQDMLEKARDIKTTMANLGDAIRITHAKWMNAKNEGHSARQIQELQDALVYYLLSLEQAERDAQAYSVFPDVIFMDFPGYDFTDTYFYLSNELAEKWKLSTKKKVNAGTFMLLTYLNFETGAAYKAHMRNMTAMQVDLGMLAPRHEKALDEEASEQLLADTRYNAGPGRVEETLQKYGYERGLGKLSDEARDYTMQALRALRQEIPVIMGDRGVLKGEITDTEILAMNTRIIRNDALMTAERVAERRYNQIKRKKNHPQWEKDLMVHIMNEVRQARERNISLDRFIQNIGEQARAWQAMQPVVELAELQNSPDLLKEARALAERRTQIYENAEDFINTKMAAFLKTPEEIKTASAQIAQPAESTQAEANIQVSQAFDDAIESVKAFSISWWQQLVAAIAASSFVVYTLSRFRGFLLGDHVVSRNRISQRIPIKDFRFMKSTIEVGFNKDKRRTQPLLRGGKNYYGYIAFTRANRLLMPFTLIFWGTLVVATNLLLRPIFKISAKTNISVKRRFMEFTWSIDQTTLIRVAGFSAIGMLSSIYAFYGALIGALIGKLLYSKPRSVPVTAKVSIAGAFVIPLLSASEVAAQTLESFASSSLVSLPFIMFFTGLLLYGLIIILGITNERTPGVQEYFTFAGKKFMGDEFDALKDIFDAYTEDDRKYLKELEKILGEKINKDKIRIELSHNLDDMLPLKSQDDDTLQIDIYYDAQIPIKLASIRYVQVYEYTGESEVVNPLKRAHKTPIIFHDFIEVGGLDDFNNPLPYSNELKGKKISKYVLMKSFDIMRSFGYEDIITHLPHHAVGRTINNYIREAQEKGYKVFREPGGKFQQLIDLDASTYRLFKRIGSKQGRPTEDAVGIKDIISNDISVLRLKKMPMHQVNDWATCAGRIYTSRDFDRMRNVMTTILKNNADALPKKLLRELKEQSFEQLRDNVHIRLDNEGAPFARFMSDDLLAVKIFYKDRFLARFDLAQIFKYSQRGRFFDMPTQSMRINAFEVAPTLENKGIGTYIFNELVHSLKAKGIKNVVLKPINVTPHIVEKKIGLVLNKDQAQIDVLSFRNPDGVSEFRLYEPIKEKHSLRTPLGVFTHAPRTESIIELDAVKPREEEKSALKSYVFINYDTVSETTLRDFNNHVWDRTRKNIDVIPVFYSFDSTLSETDIRSHIQSLLSRFNNTDRVSFDVVAKETLPENIPILAKVQAMVEGYNLTKNDNWRTIFIDEYSGEEELSALQKRLAEWGRVGLIKKEFSAAELETWKARVQNENVAPVFTIMGHLPFFLAKVLQKKTMPPEGDVRNPFRHYDTRVSEDMRMRMLSAIENMQQQILIKQAA